MRGSTKKRGTSWRARYRDDSGKEHQKSFATKGDADNWLLTELSAHARGEWVDPNAGSVTFAEYASEWLTHQHVRPNTMRQIESRVRLYLNPAFGTRQLKQIRRTHIVAVVTRMVDAGLSPLVIRYTVSTARTILDAAVRDRLITANPAADRTIALPRAERSTGTLSPAQVSMIANRIEPRLRAMVVLGAASGLRPGELAGLTLDRCIGLAEALGDGEVVELTSRRTAKSGVVLRVDRQLDGRSFATPKTAHSVRDVSIPGAVVDVLVDHVRTFGLGVHDLLFSSAQGRPVDGPRRSRSWAKAIEALDVPDGSWHGLRHHHASALLSQGVSPALVAARLGHANAGVTLSIYAHAMPSDDARALAVAEQIAVGLA